MSSAYWDNHSVNWLNEIFIAAIRWFRSLGQSARRFKMALPMACLIGATAHAAEPLVIDDRQAIEVTFGGASPHGVFAAMGEGLGEMIRREYPGSSYTYEPGTLAGAFVRTVRGELPFGLAGTAEITAALDGLKPFRRRYVLDEFTVVARIIHNITSYVAMRKDFAEHYDIKTWQDIAIRQPPMRFSMGQLGNLTVYRQASAYLDAIGVSRNDIEAWGGTIYQLPQRTSMELLKDGKADAAFSAGFHPDARVLELARATPVLLLPFGQTAIDKVANQFSAHIMSIPAEAYDFLDNDYPSTAFSAYIVASPHTDPALVYKVVKSLHTHFEILKEMHPSLAQSDQSMLPMSGAFKLHSAAKQFYREVGLLE